MDRFSLVRRILYRVFIVSKFEVTTYLEQLETLLHIQFTPDARNELYALCTDTENGGLGIFIAMLELIFSIIRPEWKDICKAARKNTEPTTDINQLDGARFYIGVNVYYSGTF